MLNLKSSSNDNVFFITFRKRRRKKEESKESTDYASIKIDLDDGPYLQSNEWCLDVKYQNNNNIYAVPIKLLLNEEITDLHDKVLANYTKWNLSFERYFISNSKREPLLLSYGDVIYDENKYIKICWVADTKQAWYWLNDNNDKFYKNDLCLYGGYTINVYQSLISKQIKFMDSKMLYCSNEAVAISKAKESTENILLAISTHQQYDASLKGMFYLEMKNYPGYYLRHNKYGFEVKTSIKMRSESFEPFITKALMQRDIPFTNTTKDIYFTIEYEAANKIFGDKTNQYFYKEHGNEKVYAYSIQFVYNKKPESNTLYIRFYVIQEDENGILHGLDVVE